MTERSQDPATAALEAALGREVLASERQRAVLLAGLFVLVIATFSFSLVFLPEGSPLVPQGVRPVVITIGVVGLAYSLVLRVVIARRIQRGQPVTAWLRFLGAFIETSLPTLAVGVTATVMPPLSALLGPAPLFFFLFITLSTLRLSFWLSAFTGLVAAVEYVVLALVVLEVSGPTGYPPELTAPAPHVYRGILLLAAGLLAAYVSRRIHGQVVSAFQTIEERNRVVNMFGQHVSPAVVDRLLQQDVEVHGELRNVCVMFLDIRDFTRFSESRSPESVVDYLNGLFVFMIDCVNRNGGIVNKFLGDGFMAVFGAPISSHDDRANAVRAAREILDEVRCRAADGRIPPTRVGLGLHAGSVVTGNIGSEQRKEYTIIGDVVNLASRIEQLNKQFGSELLASEDVLERLPDVRAAAQDIGEVEVKGRSEPVRVYRLA